jgi:mannitol/fructose-specific phosphotransferase system IIA component (Ntr-type)
MNVFDYLDKDGVIVDIRAKNKKSTITAILDHLIEKKKVDKKDRKSILKTILQREEMGSTAIGGSIAFPHARVDSVKDIIICVCTSKEGIEFDSLDQEPVNVIALLLSNQKEAGLHLKTLAFLARMLRDKYLLQKLKNAKNSEEILSLLYKQQQAV